MPGQINLLGNFQNRLDTGRIFLRENRDGYAIESSFLGGSRGQMAGRAFALMSAAIFWPSGFWLIQSASGFGGTTEAAALVVGMIVALSVVMLMLRRMPRHHRAQIDLAKGQMRVAADRDEGDEESGSELTVSFQETLEIFLKSSEDPSEPMSLYLRGRGVKGDLLIARGDKETLGALHQRLERDLKPVVRRVPRVTTRQESNQNRFPGLKPSDVA